MSLNDDPDFDGTEDVPQSPDLSDELKPRRKSVEDASQALAICRSLSQENENRVSEYARIRAKYDNIEPPFSPTLLVEEGKEYKSNFSSGFLSSLANTVLTRITMRLKRTHYLTGSSLPNGVENAVEKSECFRRAFTHMLRSWDAFPFFVSNLALETILCGKSFVSFDGPADWRPRIMRIDDAAIPNGVKQGEKPSFVRIKRIYTVAELFDFIREKDIAEDAGWNIENTVEAINAAHPIDKDEQDTPTEAALTYEDMVRELIPSYAYTSGANSIQVETLLVQEFDGSVSLWMVDSETENELFHAESIYTDMADAFQYICYEIGNGAVYGSYGIGQKIYDIAVNVEKSRNYSVDQLRNSGKFIAQTSDPNNLNQIELVVTDDYTFLAGGTFAGNTAALASNFEAWATADRYLRGMAEEKIGAFIPESQASEKTATQSQIDALKEQETRDSVIDNFLTYFGRILYMVQKRAGNVNNTALPAKIFQDTCLAQMSLEEFTYLVNKAPAQTTIEFTDSVQQAQAQFLASRIGNPAWNQYLLEKTLASIVIGPELTMQLMLPAGDQTMFIEARRQQIEEMVGLSDGLPIDVSPRDNHLVSIGVLMGDKDQMTGQWNGAISGLVNEGNLAAASNALKHFMSHYQFGQQQNVLGESENVIKSFLADMQNQMQAIASEQAKMQQAKQQQGGQMLPNPLAPPQ